MMMRLWFMYILGNVNNDHARFCTFYWKLCCSCYRMFGRLERSRAYMQDVLRFLEQLVRDMTYSTSGWTFLIGGEQRCSGEQIFMVDR